MVSSGLSNQLEFQCCYEFLQWKVPGYGAQFDHSPEL